jgi:hypothetical protein
MLQGTHNRGSRERERERARERCTRKLNLKLKGREEKGRAGQREGLLSTRSRREAE